MTPQTMTHAANGTLSDAIANASPPDWEDMPADVRKLVTLAEYLHAMWYRDTSAGRADAYAELVEQARVVGLDVDPELPW